MGTEGDEFGLGNLPAEEDSDYEAEMELHKGHADQINRLMFTGSEDTLPEEQCGVRDASWVGKLANGAMFRLAEHQVASSFTERYITKIKANPLRFFPIPIGRRTNSLPPLPSSFPSIPPSCLLSQPGMASCCVGFGLSAAMNALGDSDWQSIQQMAKRAVQATEGETERVVRRVVLLPRLPLALQLAPTYVRGGPGWSTVPQRRRYAWQARPPEAWQRWHSWPRHCCCCCCYKRPMEPSQQRRRRRM